MKMMKSGAQEMIRVDLREPACRRFEVVMTKAVLEGEVEVNPRDFGDGKWSARTFCARFADAKKGFKDYHYNLAFEPEKLTHLKAVELNNGMCGVIYTGPVLGLAISKVGRVITPEQYQISKTYCDTIVYDENYTNEKEQEHGDHMVIVRDYEVANGISAN